MSTFSFRVLNADPNKTKQTLFDVQIVSGPKNRNCSYQASGKLDVRSPNFILTGKFKVKEPWNGRITLYCNDDVEIKYEKVNPDKITNDEFNFMLLELNSSQKGLRRIFDLLPMSTEKFRLLPEFKQHKMDTSCSYFRFDYESSLSLLFVKERLSELTGEELVDQFNKLQIYPWHSWFYKFLNKKLRETEYLKFHRYRHEHVKKPINPMFLRAFRLYSYLKMLNLKQGHEMFRVSDLYQCYLSHPQWATIAYENNDNLENLPESFDFLMFQGLENSNYQKDAPLEYVSLRYNVMINRQVIKSLKKVAENDFNFTKGKGGYTPCAPAHKLSENQSRAVKHALSNRLTFLEGAPGTGKTEVLVAIMAELCTLGVNPMVVTFVGMMVDSLQKRFGNRPECANTIHYVCSCVEGNKDALEWTSKFQVLIIDEGSNVEIKLFNRILKCLPNLARIIIVGDLGQIYPIEAGCPFADLVSTYPQHSFMLHENKRVDPSSRHLAEAAAKIRKGEEIETDDECLRIVPRSDTFIKEYVQNHVHSPEDTLNVQIVTLKNTVRRELNNRMENALISKGLLKQKGYKSFGGFPLRIGKKITFTENLKQTDKSDAVKNGEIGKIEKVIKDVLYFKVSSGKMKKVDLSELESRHIENGYAVSCNKSQGSEWDNVIYWIHANPFEHFTREYSYVAISRARKSCIIVGEKEELTKMCRFKAKERNSLLRYYLFLEKIEEFEQFERDDEVVLTEKFKILSPDVLAVPILSEVMKKVALKKLKN